MLFVYTYAQYKTDDDILPELQRTFAMLEAHGRESDLTVSEQRLGMIARKLSFDVVVFVYDVTRTDGRWVERKGAVNGNMCFPSDVFHKRFGSEFDAGEPLLIKADKDSNPIHDVSASGFIAFQAARTQRLLGSQINPEMISTSQWVFETHEGQLQDPEAWRIPIFPVVGVNLNATRVEEFLGDSDWSGIKWVSPIQFPGPAPS